MKKLSIVKMILDIALVIVFALLFNKMVFTGMAFHEIAGIVICGAFLLHKLFNWKWIKKVTKGLFGRQMPLRAKLCYLLDVILLLCMAFILISGISISKVVFPNLQIGTSLNFKQLHVSVSYLTLLFLGIHVGLHWKWVMDMFKKLVRLPANKVTPWIARVLAVGVLLFGSYNIYTTSYISKANIFAGGGKGGFEMRGGDRGDFPAADNSLQNDITTSDAQQDDSTTSNTQQDTSSTSDAQQDASSTGSAQQDNSSITGDVQQSGDATQDKLARGQGRGMGKGPGGSRPEGVGHDGNAAGGSNPFSVIINYLGILSVFSTITYYVERLLIRLKRKKIVKSEL